MKKMTMTEFNEKFTKALDGTGNDLINELVRVAPVDTGFLRESMRHEVVNNKLNIHMPEYAFYVEFGTNAHEIRAVNAKALHWKSGGKDHFAKVVWHPGTDPNPFIRRTINTKLRDIFYINLKRQLT
jgi:hypothetical protein